MPDVVLYAEHIPLPRLRHQVPIGIPDPFLYLELDGVKHIVIGAMEIPGCPRWAPTSCIHSRSTAPTT